MNRTLKPELLDSRPPDDLAARHSRRDLRVVNRIIGNERWFLQVLRSKLRLGERILESGAGTGSIGMALSAAGFIIDSLDICPRPKGCLQLFYEEPWGQIRGGISPHSLRPYTAVE
jgi:hypothetical protein